MVAVHRTHSDLAGFGAAADRAGAQAGEHLAAGEHKAAHEALGLGERAKVAAEMVGLLGAQCSESVLKIVEWEGASLIVELVVEGTDSAVVAAERGVSRAVQVEQLRDAVALLASRYEHLAKAHLHEDLVVSLRAALVGKRAPQPHSSQRHGTEDPDHKDQGHADHYHS